MLKLLKESSAAKRVVSTSARAEQSATVLNVEGLSLEQQVLIPYIELMSPCGNVPIVSFKSSQNRRKFSKASVEIFFVAFIQLLLKWFCRLLITYCPIAIQKYEYGHRQDLRVVSSDVRLFTLKILNPSHHALIHVKYKME